MTFNKKLIINTKLFIYALISIFLFVNLCLASKTSDQPSAAFTLKYSATIMSFQGDVFVTSGNTSYKINSLKQIINKGDVLQTENGRISLLFNDGSTANIMPNTQVEFLSALNVVLNPIATISQFKGDVFILSGADINEVLYQNQPMAQGDIVQTKNGTATIAFKDGSTIKVRPFSNVSVRERQEETGWLFKTKQLTRRMTCFIGKIRFKSGKSKIKNFLQTPNAIAGVKGSETDWGFNNNNALLNPITGSYDTQGSVRRGNFPDPGRNAASRSNVYRSFNNAYQSKEQASATKNNVNEAQSRVDTLNVVKQASQQLAKNPDPIVKQESKVVATATETIMQREKANVVVAKLISKKNEIREKTSTKKETVTSQKVEKTSGQIVKLNEKIIEAENLLKESDKAVVEAKKAIETNNLKLADKSKKTATQTTVLVDAIAAEIGTDAKQSFLNMESGKAETTGKVKQGVFRNPGQQAAENNPVFKSFDNAQKTSKKAQTQDNKVGMAKSNVSALTVVKQAAEELKQNPDATVRKEATVVATATSTLIMSEKANVVVEELKQKQEQLVRQAQVPAPLPPGTPPPAPLASGVVPPPAPLKTPEEIQQTQNEMDKLNAAIIAAEVVKEETEQTVLIAKEAIQTNNINLAKEAEQKTAQTQQQLNTIAKDSGVAQINQQNQQTTQQQQQQTTQQQQQTKEEQKTEEKPTTKPTTTKPPTTSTSSSTSSTTKETTKKTTISPAQ